MSSERHRNLLENISDEYEEDAYRVVAVDESFPGIVRESQGQDLGRVDMLLDDAYSPTYKVVEVVKGSGLSPEKLEGKFEDS